MFAAGKRQFSPYVALNVPSETPFSSKQYQWSTLESIESSKTVADEDDDRLSIFIETVKNEAKLEPEKPIEAESDTNEGFSLEAANDFIIALRNFLSTKNLSQFNMHPIKPSELFFAEPHWEWKNNSEMDEVEDEKLKILSETEKNEYCGKRALELSQNFLFSVYRTLIEALKKSAKDGKENDDFFKAMLANLRKVFTKVLADWHSTKELWIKVISAEYAVKKQKICSKMRKK